MQFRGFSESTRGWHLAAISAMALAGVAPSVRAESGKLFACEGPFVQGGATLCRTAPWTRIRLGEAKTQADANGIVILGFDRNAPEEETARLELPDGRRGEYRFAIEQRSYAISRIDGLPPSQVDRFTQSQLAKIEASSARKRVGDASRAPIAGFRERLAWPLDARKTTSFGAQRILNGVAKRPHYGVDLAAPKGSPIRAPAEGVVSLADEDLYFEGAMIVIDHGQGFLSKYLHVSRIDVEPGQRVQRGDVIGAVGSRGRSTGPHLCWRLKWRDRNLDPELWLAPATGARSSP